MRNVRLGVVCAALVTACFALTSCSGGSGSSSQTSTPPAVSVSVSPSSATVQADQTQQFTATVQNTTNTAVTWQVNGVAGGNATIGTISSAGLYTAPDPVPNPASVTVTAVSQADTTKSGSSSVSLAYGKPILTSVSPTSVPVGSGDTTLQLKGSGFSKVSTVSLNGTVLSATFGSPSQLSVTAPASMLATAAAYSVIVSNPPPGGGTSSAATFDVDNPTPTATSVTPSSVPAGSGATTLQVAGSGFITASTVSLNGTAVTTALSSSSQLSATVPAKMLVTGTAYSVTVSNPAPGGGTSSPQTFDVDNPVPAIASISPIAVPVGSNSTTLTINGSNFVPGSSAAFNGAQHPITFVSAAQISITLTANDQSVPGAFPVEVTNPSPGGGNSNQLFFSAYAPPSSTGSTAVVVETINVGGTMETVDVAYVPMPSLGLVAAVNVDASPAPGTDLATGAVIADIPMPTGYVPNFSAADPADGDVLVGSYGSAQIQVISIATQQIANSYILNAGSGVQFSGGTCQVCGLVVDDTPGRGFAVASTSNGYFVFNPVNGNSEMEGSFNAPPAENFAYDIQLESVLNPNYGCSLFGCGSGGMQLLSLTTGGVINSVVGSVGSEPDSAAVDPVTGLAVIPDEPTGIQYLLNLAGLPPSTSPASTNLLTSLPARTDTLPPTRPYSRGGGSTYSATTSATLAATTFPGDGGSASGTRANLPPPESFTLRAQRRAWFMRGRQSPDNKPAAAHLLRALGEAKAIRFARRRILATNSQQPSVANLVSGATWTESGPRPLNTAGSTTPGGAAAEQDYGDVSGRVTSIAVDLGNDPSGNTVYVGAAYGGVWKCVVNAEQSAATCTALDDSMASLSVGAIALKSAGGQTTMFVGTGEANFSPYDSYYGVGIVVLTSSDGGSSWALTNEATSANNGQYSLLGLAFSKILVDPNFPNIVIAAATTACCTTGLSPQPAPGIYRSTDGGNSWSLVLGGSSATDIAYDPTRALYYAAFSNNNIWKSSDSGATWSQLSASPYGFFRASLATRGGKVWALMADPNGAPYAPAFSGLTGLSESDDGGNTWVAVSIPTSSEFSGQLRYDMDIAAPPGTSGLVIGGIDLFSASDINGTNTAWTDLTQGYAASAGAVHPDQHAIAVAGSQEWYIGNDGGLWLTVNGGQAWINLNSTLGNIQFVSVSSDQKSAGALLGGSQDNGTSATNGSGQTWKRFYPGDGGYTAANPSASSAYFDQYFGEYPNYLDPSSSQYSGYVTRFDDDGSCFPASSDSVQDGPGTLDTDNDPSCVYFLGENSAFYFPFELNPTNPDDILVGTCRVLEGPADPSSTLTQWTPISGDLTSGDEALFGGPCSQYPGPYIQTIAGAPSSPNYVYAGTSDGRVQATANANCPFETTCAATPTWSLIFTSPSSHPIGAIAVSPVDPQTVYVGVQGFGNGGTTGGQHVYKITGAATAPTITDITGNLPDSPVNSILIDPDAPNNVYVATDVGVFVTQDSGVANEVWERLAPGLPNATVMQLSITPQSLGPEMIIAATHGRGAWETPALPGNPDFVLQLTPSSQAVNPGDPATLTVSTTSLYGDSETIALSCNSPTTGCTISPSTVTAGGSATMTVSVSSLVPGFNDVTVSAAGTTNTHAQTAGVSVQDFSLGLPSGTGSVPLGQSAQFSLELTSATGYVNPVSLACSNPPVGISCTFEPSTISSQQPLSTLAISAGATASTGSYSITIAGTSGDLTHMVSLVLTVNAAPVQASLTLPSTSFEIGPGTNTCTQAFDWTMDAIEPSTHILAVGQEFADCIGAAQLQTSATSGTPSAPTVVRFGELPADPDGNIWNNGGDPHGIVVFTSVVDGKAYGFVVEGSPSVYDPNGTTNGSPGWIAKINLADFLAAPASSNGEIDPTTMQQLVTFIRTH